MTLLQNLKYTSSSFCILIQLVILLISAHSSVLHHQLLLAYAALLIVLLSIICSLFIFFWIAIAVHLELVVLISINCGENFSGLLYWDVMDLEYLQGLILQLWVSFLGLFFNPFFFNISGSLLLLPVVKEVIILFAQFFNTVFELPMCQKVILCKDYPLTLFAPVLWVIFTARFVHYVWPHYPHTYFGVENA